MSGWFQLPQLRAMSLAGPDALTFAQSQFSANADSFVGSRFSPLAWCNPSGRVIAFMLARRSDPGLDLVLPAGQAAAIRKRLQLYSIGHKIQLGPDQAIAGHLQPPAAAALLFDASGRALKVTDEAPGADPALLAQWQRLDLCAGLPWLAGESSEKHLPQSLGLDTLGAISWDKGCYPGQEVVARLHYLGKAKQGLRGVIISGAEVPAAHAELRDEENRRAGHWLGGLEASGEVLGLAVLGKAIAADVRLHFPVLPTPHQVRLCALTSLC